MSDCVDGGQQANLTNIDSGSRGTVYFDTFESRRESYIGLAYSMGAVKVARMAPEPAHPGDAQEKRAGRKVLALVLPVSSILGSTPVQAGKPAPRLASQAPALSLFRTSPEHFQIAATETLAPITHRIVILRWGFITLALPAAGRGNQPALIGAQSLVVSTTITYTYDPLNRLKNADYNDGTYFHYTYDAVGNRLTETALGGAAKTYTYDAANRLTSADGVSYTWDNNGNLLDDSAHTYTYDHANRLAGVQGTGTQVTFGYNGLGDRLQQTANSVTTSYTVDLNTGLTQVLADGTSTYLYGAGRIAQQSAAGKEYFLGDALGSVRQLADTNGAVSLARSYQPYGKLLASDGGGVTSYGFTNEYTSQGLIYLRTRWYSPSQGRFISRDTWMGDNDHPMSYNAWLYVYSDPVNLKDPSGYYCLDENLDGRCDPGWECYSIRNEAARERCFAKYCSASSPIDCKTMPGYYRPKVCNTFLAMREKPGWWNRNSIGTLTPQRFLGLFLRMEFSDRAKNIDEGIKKATTVRNFYYLCSGLPGNTCNSLSANDIINYIAFKKLAITGGRDLLVPREASSSEISAKWKDRPGYSNADTFEDAFLYPDAWRSGIGNHNVPVDWGNISMMKTYYPGDKERYDRYAAAVKGLSEHMTYIEQDKVYLRRGGNNGDDAFVILTYAQLRYWFPNQFEK